MASPAAERKPGDTRRQREVRIGRAASWRRGGLALLATLGTLGVAVAAALLTGPGIGPITGRIESASFAAAAVLRSVVQVVPVGYALGAGMIAAVNPCGFAMLPAYLGLYLGTGDGWEESPQLGVRFRRALSVSGTVGFSFVLLFGIAGLALRLATSAIAGYLPWVGLTVGLLMVLVAGRMLAGGTLYTSVGERVADRLQAGTRQGGLRGYFIYGIAYGLASLSCTLPVFLAVVGSAVALNGLLAGALQFVLYALGMGLVISVLTLSVAFFKQAVLQQAVLQYARKALPYVQQASTLLLLVAGAYIVYYWLTLGGLLRLTGL